LNGGSSDSPIRLAGHDGRPVDPSSGLIWEAMHAAVTARGFRIEQREVGAATALGGLIALNHVPSVIAEADDLAVPVSRRTLVLFEPRITDPVAHSPRTLARYGQVLSPSPYWPHGTADAVFPWPQDSMPHEIESPDSWSQRLRAGSIVQSNKFSAISGERYSLRRRVVARAHACGVPVDLIGPEWESTTAARFENWCRSAHAAARSGHVPDLRGLRCPRPPLGRYRGSTEDKHVVVSRYRVSICIENSGDYVSEKLFDAIRAQTLPVYVGPADLIPEALQPFDLNTPPDPEAIVERTADLLAMPDGDQHDLVAQLVDATRHSDERRSPVRVYSSIARCAVDHWPEQ
jgi:hypothetical protein